jgi:hypothetical protein
MKIKIEVYLRIWHTQYDNHDEIPCDYEYYNLRVI